MHRKVFGRRVNNSESNTETVILFMARDYVL